MRKSNSIDMLNGPLFSKILLFSIPLMLSSILQLLFNAADIIVVGQFTGSDAIAAVGATTALINLLVNLFVGVSIGTSVIVGKYLGARDYDNVEKSVHASIYFALISGFIMIFVGIILAKPLLAWMATPDNVIDLSTLYMRIYFLSMPAFMVYNFGAAILRSIGDTKRPLYFLGIAGIVNVILNLILVIVFHLGVAGVAIATTVSQYISATLVVLSLMESEYPLKLKPKELKFHEHIVIDMLKVGLPAGLQSVIFSLSNVLIQSSVNSFGSLVMAGNTAAANIEGFVYAAMNSIYQACLTFTSQNMGAKNYHRIDKILINCLIIVTAVGLIFGVGAYVFGHQLLGIYTTDAQVIEYGINRLMLVCAPYFLCGLMDVMVGSLRGIGYSIMPMIVSLTGACLFRIIWIYTIFAMYHTQFVLYISYPISWALTAFIHFVCYMVVRRKFVIKGA